MHGSGRKESDMERGMMMMMTTGEVVGLVKETEKQEERVRKKRKRPYMEGKGMRREGRRKGDKMLSYGGTGETARTRLSREGRKGTRKSRQKRHA